jgi:hypothetical protein
MRIILTGLFLFQFYFSFAQDTIVFPKWSVNIKPLGIFIDYTPNITAGIQYRFSRHFVAELHGGIVQNIQGIPDEEEQKDINMSGYTLKAEVKYLVFTKWYFSLQGFYFDYSKSDKEFVWRMAQQYQQQLKLDKDITESGFNLKMGYVIRRDKKIFFEVFGGTGLMFRNVTTHELPEDAQLIDTNTFRQDEEGNSILPAYNFGISIGLRL